MVEDVISVKETVLNEPFEEGRERIAAGIKFVINQIVISEKTRFKKLAKIDGFIKVKDKITPVKYVTTSAVIVKQCEEFLAAYGKDKGFIRPNIQVEVMEKLSENGYKYLTFI